MFSYFERLLNPFPPEEPTQPPMGLFAFCHHYTKGVWKILVLMSIFTALIAVIEVSLFGFLGNIVDWLSQADRETFLSEQGRVLGLMALAVLALPLIVFFQSALIHQTLLGNYPMIIRWQAHRYLLNQSISFFNDEFAGRIGTKVMQTSLAVREAVMKVLDVLLYVSVYFTGMVVLFATADLRLAVPLLVWFIGYVALLWIFVPRLRTISKDQADARSDMVGRVVDSYTNINTVKLFSHAGREAAYSKAGMGGFLITVHRQMRMVTLFHTCLYTLNAVLLLAVGSLSIQLWLSESITVGAIAVAIGLVLRLGGMSQWIMWEMSALFENIGTVQDGMTTLANPQSVMDVENALELDVPAGRIEFDDIRFHYGKEEGVIESLNLTILPGQKIGLVGRSGAGKTTLMNVLLRLYDLESGAIRIDGKDTAQVSQNSLRANIGVVTQDTSLLHRSVAENIAYGRPDASPAQIIESAKRANAHDFILGLEDGKGRKGYDAFVGERGVKLSGGQRQRIAIARVFLKDAPILVLDEATSALDSEVESAIQENLMDLMDGKTVIAIAHRLSTIAALDRLIVMDKGNIIEDGSHQQLTQDNGLYAQLWQRQSGGFIAREKGQAAE